MNEDTKRLCWYGGYFAMIAAIALLIWWEKDQESKDRYSVTCYADSATPIYEGVSIGKVRGGTEHGFRFTDTDNLQQRIAANCIITQLPSEN